MESFNDTSNILLFYEKQKLRPKILFKDLMDELRSLLDHESNVKISCYNVFIIFRCFRILRSLEIIIMNYVKNSIL